VLAGKPTLLDNCSVHFCTEFKIFLSVCLFKIFLSRLWFYTVETMGVGRIFSRGASRGFS